MQTNLVVEWNWRRIGTIDNLKPFMVNFAVRWKRALMDKDVPPKSWGDWLRRRAGQVKGIVDRIVYMTGGECEMVESSNRTFQVSLIHPNRVLASEFGPREMEHQPSQDSICAMY